MAILGFALLTVFFLLSQFFYTSTGAPAVPAGTSSIVVVTVLDRTAWSNEYIQKIVKNREDYAKRHGKATATQSLSSCPVTLLMSHNCDSGYTNFFANVSDYETVLDNAPKSWAVLPALRHAMASNPYSKYFFHLDAHALIMNPSKSLESHVLDKDRLESLMLKDVSVVPPDSIIKTFSHIQAQDVDLIMTTDAEDLSSGSFLLRQGDFAKYFLDFWFDPLYISYNFAKAETHVLVSEETHYASIFLAFLFIRRTPLVGCSPYQIRFFIFCFCFMISCVTRLSN